MKAVITVVGADKVGIIAKVSGKCLEYNVNILDITQHVVDSYFTMTMVAGSDVLQFVYDSIQNGALTPAGQGAADDTPVMFEAISPDPVAASATPRDISFVVAVCSSTAEAMVSW